MSTTFAAFLRPFTGRLAGLALLAIREFAPKSMVWLGWAC